MIAISATSNSRSRTTRLKKGAALPFTSTKSNLSVRVLNCLVTSWSSISVFSILLLRFLVILKRESGVLLGQRDLRVVRGAQVLELVLLRPPIEIGRAGKEVQQHGEVPGDAHRGPDAPQRGPAIGVERGDRAGAVILDQRARE